MGDATWSWGVWISLDKRGTRGACDWAQGHDPTVGGTEPGVSAELAWDSRSPSLSALPSQKKEINFRIIILQRQEPDVGLE